MAINDDLISVATLCANVADAAIDQLIRLGARPTDSAAATAWDAQDAVLKNKISTLNNLSSSISALIVSNALQDVWPALDTLGGVTSSAQVNIDKIADISKAMAAIASVINFGVSTIKVATQPTATNAQSLASAFTNMVGSLKNT